jgi:hypothetical protein
MPRLAPLPREAVTDLEDILRASESRMGFAPNSQLIMARRPEILRAFDQLGAAINGPSSTINPQLRNMARRWRVVPLDEATAWRTPLSASALQRRRRMHSGFERSPLFSEAERAALRVGNAPRRCRTR